MHLTKPFFLAALAWALLTAGSRLSAQDDSLLAQSVAWLTGDPAVVQGPRNYAEDWACPYGDCGCCSQCCRQSNVFGSLELLLWWGKGTSLPPLVSTGPLGPPANGVVLFGNELAAGKIQTGGRITFGMWLDADRNVAAGGRFFGLGGDTTRFGAASDGTQPLARPFFDPLLNVPSAFFVAAPNISAGSVNAFATTSNIIGAEAFSEIMLYRDGRRRVDLVGGYQFFRLDDWLQIDSTTLTPILPAPLVNVQITDRFSTRNQFHGGEVGVRGRMANGQWSLDALGVVGIGNMNQQVTITGATNVNGLTNPGGILAQPTNMGTYTRDRLAFIPQFTGNLKYHVTPNASFHIGYSILWISRIATTGDQVDTEVNPSQIGGGPLVGPARPQFVFRDREYWLQGINFGVNWDF